MPQGCDGWVSLGEAVGNVMTDLQAKMAAPAPTLEHLAQATAIIGDLSLKELTGKSVMREVTTYRQVFMWLGVRRMGLSAAAVGRFLDRDHTTVIHGVRSIQKRLSVYSSETLGMVEDVWAAAQKLSRGEAVKRKVMTTGVVVIKASLPPPEVKPRELKHWSHYSVCSPEWWAANNAEFIKGMQKASRNVFLQAGE